MSVSDLGTFLKDLGLSPLGVGLIMTFVVLVTSVPVRGRLGLLYRWIFGRAERHAAEVEQAKVAERAQQEAELADAERERDAYRERWLKEWERAEPREGYIAEDSNWHADLAATQPELYRQLPPHRTFQQFHAEWKRDRARLAQYQGHYDNEIPPIDGPAAEGG